jgi:hypothetical protein
LEGGLPVLGKLLAEWAWRGGAVFVAGWLLERFWPW